MCNCEPAEFWIIKTRVARKEYKCGECKEAIAPGQKYNYWCGKGDDGFFDFKMCLQCEQDWNLLKDIIYEATTDYEGCMHYGEFPQLLEEVIANGWLEAENLTEDDPLRKLVERWLPHFYDFGESQEEVPEHWCLEENRQLHFSFALS